MLIDYLRDRYPDRVEEFLAGRRSLDARHHRVYLGDVVNHEILSEVETYRFLRSLPRVMSQADIFARFREHGESFQAGIQQANEPQGGYHVRDASAFGFSEAARSKHAATLLTAGDVEGFAKMMNVSQLGDRVGKVTDPAYRRLKFLEDDALVAMEQNRFALREIAGDYHVSTDNIDRMVSISLGCPGVLGARLSGAGLGGMLIVLGREGFHETLDPLLERRYYQPLGKEFRKFRIVPSEGARFH